MPDAPSNFITVFTFRLCIKSNFCSSAAKDSYQVTSLHLQVLQWHQRRVLPMRQVMDFAYMIQYLSKESGQEDAARGASNDSHTSEIFVF